jgi:hypothetical protein
MLPPSYIGCLDRPGLFRRSVLLSHDSACRDGRDRVQDGFDFTRFDAISSDLDLTVDAAETLQGAIGSEASKILGLLREDFG